MENRNYDNEQWWVNLTVAQKEHIATKVFGKMTTEEQEDLVDAGLEVGIYENERVILYPECSKVWNSLTDVKKSRIHQHCLDDHDFKMKNWSEGGTFSY